MQRLAKPCPLGSLVQIQPQASIREISLIVEHLASNQETRGQYPYLTLPKVPAVPLPEWLAGITVLSTPLGFKFTSPHGVGGIPLL